MAPEAAEFRRRLAHLFRSVADKLDPPGFEYRMYYQSGEVRDWPKVSDALRFAMRRDDFLK